MNNNRQITFQPQPFDRFKMGQSSSTDTTERLRTLISSEPKSITKNFKKLFKQYDTDSSGSIDQHEATQFINDFLTIQNLDVETDTVKMVARAIFSIADENGDGLLSKDEFLVSLLKYEEIERNVSEQMMEVIGDPREILNNSRRNVEKSRIRQDTLRSRNEAPQKEEPIQKTEDSSSEESLPGSSPSEIDHYRTPKD